MNVIYFIPSISEHKRLILKVVSSVIPLKMKNDFNYITKVILYYT